MERRPKLSLEDVRRACAAIDAAGQKVTARKVREYLDGGSYSTILKHVKTWEMQGGPEAVEEAETEAPIGPPPKLLLALNAVWRDAQAEASREVAEIRRSADEAIAAAQEAAKRAEQQLVTVQALLDQERARGAELREDLVRSTERETQLLAQLRAAGVPAPKKADRSKAPGVSFSRPPVVPGEPLAPISAAPR